MEIYKDIKGYEGKYQVSNLGNVKSLERRVKCSGGKTKLNKERILKQCTGSHGYYVVGLFNNGKPKKFCVHQLVAMTFLNHTPCKYKLVIDHKNDNPLDNRVCNLHIVTHRKNISKGIKGVTSNITGVSKRKNRWLATIYIDGREYNLGGFDTELEAAEAYKKALHEWETKSIKPCK